MNSGCQLTYIFNTLLSAVVLNYARQKVGMSVLPPKDRCNILGCGLVCGGDDGVSGYYSVAQFEGTAAVLKNLGLVMKAEFFENHSAEFLQLRRVVLPRDPSRAFIVKDPFKFLIKFPIFFASEVLLIDLANSTYRVREARLRELVIARCLSALALSPLNPIITPFAFAVLDSLGFNFNQQQVTELASNLRNFEDRWHMDMLKPLLLNAAFQKIRQIYDEFTLDPSFEHVLIYYSEIFSVGVEQIREFQRDVQRDFVQAARVFLTYKNFHDSFYYYPDNYSSAQVGGFNHPRAAFCPDLEQVVSAVEAGHFISFKVGNPDLYPIQTKLFACDPFVNVTTISERRLYETPPGVVVVEDVPPVVKVGTSAGEETSYLLNDGNRF